MARSRTGWFAVAALVAALGGTACGGGGGDEIDLGADRPAVSISETGTLDVADLAEPPELETSGEDFDQVVRSLHRFEQWLLANPDSPLGTEIYQPESPAARAAFTLLVDLNQRGVAAHVVGSEVLSVEVLERPDQGTVEVRYTDTRTAREEIDTETGDVVDREDYEPQRWVFDATLRLGFDGKWRFDTVSFIESSPLAG